MTCPITLVKPAGIPAQLRRAIRRLTTGQTRTANREEREARIRALAECLAARGAK